MNLLLSHNKRASFSNGLLLVCFLSLTVCLSGCKTSLKGLSSFPEESPCLSSKVQLTVPHKDATLTVNGTMKLIKNERVQFSFLMPILRTEIVRMEITPDEVLLVDRMGKRYVEASREELKSVLPRKADFTHLQKLLIKAAKPGGKTTLKANELGFSSLKKGKIVLSDFSDKEFSLKATKVSSRYTKVEWPELVDMLMKL